MSEDVQNETKERLYDDDTANIKCMEKEDTDGCDLPVKKEEASGSMFVMELLICSMILWCFLFMVNISPNEKIILKVDEVLSTNSSVTIISDIEEQVEEAVAVLLAE